MKLHATVAILAFGLTLLTGCCLRCPEEIPPHQRRTIVAYLECEECIDGELDAVLELGPTAVPTLRATLLQGLSPASRTQLTLQLREVYAGRVAYGRDHPDSMPSMSEEEFVAHHVGNRDALYRARAAWALGCIRSPAALDALRESLLSTQRPGVEQVISRALERPQP